MVDQIHWGVIFAFSLAVALITVMPEIYARFKSPARWTPISSPPHMIGDDYHYFSLLNNIHRRFLNCFYGTNLTVLPLSANSRFQSFGYFFNSVPFHIGFLIKDRRLGVIFVRLWNRILLGISVAVLASILFLSLGITPTTELLLLTYLSFFLFFPGPFGLQVLSSIARQIKNPRYIYDRANANDLTRAMFSETTGPLLLSACAVLLIPINVQYFAVLASVGLLFVVILFFHYFPAAIVFSWLLFLVLLINQLFFLAITCCILTSGLLFFYLYTVSRSKIGQDLFAHADGGKIFLFRRYYFVNIASISFFVIVVALLISKTPRVEVLLLYFGSGVFLFTFFFTKHQASRFWDRAAVIPFQLMSTVASVTIVGPLLPDIVIIIFIAAFSLMLIYYHYRQSRFLYQAGATLLPENIEFGHDICPQNNASKVATSRIIATNSIELAYSVYMFSGDESLLRNYSVQPYGYREHLRFICTNFKVLGYTFSECERLLTKFVNYKDWQFDRPFKRQSDAAECCYAHTIQFMATNREFNQGLVRDGMYTEKGWTESYKRLLREIWDSIDVARFSTVHKIKVERPY